MFFYYNNDNHCHIIVIKYGGPLMHINMELTPHSDGTGIQLQIPRPGILISHNLRMGPLTVQVRLGLGFSADLPGKIGTPFPRRGSLRPNAKSWI